MILLVVDMQKALVCRDLYQYETLTKRIIRLVTKARKGKTEVIFFQHDAGENTGLSKGDIGFEIIGDLKPLDNEKVFTKTINSCFGNSEFKNYMEKQKDKRIMIVGLQTNYCIDATVKSAFERGYEVIIPKGTNSTFDNKYMSAKTTVDYYNLDVWEGLVDLVTIEEAVKMIG
ncbi:MAG: isochorismatase family protein [Bacilli bacterium]|nr:isochorismatase family protein [Bacilli bacterium]